MSEPSLSSTGMSRPKLLKSATAALVGALPDHATPKEQANQLGKKLEEMGITGFRIEPSQVQELLKTMPGDTEDSRMIRLLVCLSYVVGARAVTPISDFKVGVAGLGASGAIYLGVNIELPRSSLAFSVHGEQCMINSLNMGREPKLLILAVNQPPCGHCRQFINELDGVADLRFIVAGKEAGRQKDLLPQSFGPADLQIKERLLYDTPLRFRLSTQARRPGSEATFTTDADQALSLLGPEVLEQTLSLLRRSWAPYTRTAAALLLGLRRAGDEAIRWCFGVYVENAAYNPSLTPLQSALASMVGMGYSFEHIQEAILFEQRDVISKIYHKAMVVAGLTAIAPSVHLHVVAVEECEPEGDVC